MTFRQVFAVTVWVLWFHRNNIHFKGAQTNIPTIIDSIYHHLGWFLRDKAPVQAMGSAKGRGSASSYVGWTKSASGWFKINCDASMMVQSGKAGLGCVLRDEMGEFITGRSVKHIFNPSILVLELKAISQGLILSKEAGCRKLEVESDSSIATDLITGKLDGDSQMYCQEIKDDLAFVGGFSPWFEACSFAHTLRSGNYLAHRFAKHALEVESSILFTEKPVWDSDSLNGFSEPVGV